MRLKSRILKAVQNCQATLWDVKMKEELLVVCTVRCPVPGRMERFCPSHHGIVTIRALLCLFSSLLGSSSEQFR